MQLSSRCYLIDTLCQVFPALLYIFTQDTHKPALNSTVLSRTTCFVTCGRLCRGHMWHVVKSHFLFSHTSKLCFNWFIYFFLRRLLSSEVWTQAWFSGTHRWEDLHPCVVFLFWSALEVQIWMVLEVLCNTQDLIPFMWLKLNCASVHLILLHRLILAMS